MPRDHLFIVFGNAIAKTVPMEECRRCLSRYVQENTLSREESNLVMKWQCRKEMAKKRRGAILKHGHKFFHTLCWLLLNLGRPITALIQSSGSTKE